MVLLGAASPDSLQPLNISQIENPSDNPRDFHQAPGGINDNLNAGPGDFLCTSIQDLARIGYGAII